MKAISGGKVKVHGVHPPEGHDIPGVRSIDQLKMTDHYRPAEYNELIEVSNKDAFDMCRRLNQEESLIAGPSSGMQVVGALRLMKDEPGNVGVIIFCDDVFKYTTSITKHCPEVFPDQQGPRFENAELNALQSVLDAAKDGPDSLGLEELVELKAAIKTVDTAKRPIIIDVRSKEDFNSKLRALGAANVPMAELTGQADNSEVEQVFDFAGAVRKKRKTADAKSSRSHKDVVDDAFRAVFGGRMLDLDAPIVLV